MIDLVGHLRIVGLILVVIGMGHGLLPRVLGWSADMGAVSLVTRQVSYVHCFFIGLTCILSGTLLLVHADALTGPGPITSSLLVGLLVFWTARWWIQLCVFDPTLWRGDRLRTLGHVGFVVLWSYVVATHALALVAHLGRG